VHANRRWLWVLGPGLMVMLADTDAGSVVTAAQSGAAWGYRLLLLQVLLVPVLYVVMELTARVGLTTGKGFAELVRDELGPRWAVVCVAALAVAVAGALVTEFAGIAGVAASYGIPRAASVLPAAAFLIALVVWGTHRRVELVALALGAFELAFVAAALLAHPHAGAIARGVVGQPLGGGYIALVAANIGAVVMPWMVFFQQGAVVEKRLGMRDLRAARVDIALGAVVTQIVMASVLVAAAATFRGGSLHTIGDLSSALAPALGGATAHLVLAAGVLGAALVAAIVVSLALAWAVAETCRRPRRSPLFYGIYAGAVAAGATLVLATPSLVQLAVRIEILNALLLPLVLGLLVLLARRVLPRRRAYGRLALAFVFVVAFWL
jgi:Mn2+/Fe2+ NRAMP family transporter